jgi:hypothetical protein
LRIAPPALRLDGLAIHLRSWSQGRQGGIDGGVELVGVVEQLVEGRQRLEADGPPGGSPRRVDDHIGALDVVGRLLSIAGEPGGRRFRPGIAETGQVVVGVQDDRGDPLQGALLDDPAQQHGLTRTRAGEDRRVLTQRL